MISIALDEGVDVALDALLADRLVFLCGAGLSMSPPSDLPSAAALAAAAKQKYDGLHGPSRAPLPEDIGEQAEFFFQRGELDTVYLRTLIEQHVFAGQPNSGHRAVADFLLAGAVRMTVSTNVDTMIETAGQLLLGQVGVGIERDKIATLPTGTSPLLKIHGCWSIDRANTVWAKSQLAVDPVASRVAWSKQWLSVNLLDRDLVIIGYFTDWDYLNEVLEGTLGAVAPARVIVVNPSELDQLEEKAPGLFALGQRAKVSFLHIKAYGDAFLEALRRRFSETFFRRAVQAGAQAYHDLTGAVPDPAWSESHVSDCDTLWQVRRDIEGCAPKQPATMRLPPPEPALGLTLLQLRARGAVQEGPHWMLSSRRIRLLRTPNQMLHQVKAAHARETPPIVAPDFTVAVGAEDVPLPSHLVRGGSSPSITRGAAGVWLTRPQAVQEFGL